jgi:glycosyltransferase involved in cell wall biosynthesis
MKISNPLVSVVMPVYNSENYIVEAIESILNQTYKNFEFIIINDGSTDKTLDIIKKYAKKDKRIKVVNNEKNLKICKSLNKGILLSKGKYIARADGDDISLKNRFKEQIEFLEKNKDVGVVGGYMQIFNGETGKNISIRRYETDDKKLKKNIFFYSPLSHPTVVFRKEVFNKLGMYDENYHDCEDLELWFRIGSKYKFANIPKILIKYRYHPNSITVRKIRRMEILSNKLRWKNSKNPAYSFGFKAFVYNSLHLISLYTVPSKFKIWLFDKLRDNKK